MSLLIELAKSNDLLQANYIVPATRHFLKIPKNKYLFFRTPSGARTPTLANISTSHLASLAALNTSQPLNSETTTGLTFHPYVNTLGEGCFPLWDPIPQSRWPDHATGTKIKTWAKWGWFHTQCAFIPKWRRPNIKCPFDRRAETVYWDKKVEGPHDW